MATLLRGFIKKIVERWAEAILCKRVKTAMTGRRCVGSIILYGKGSDEKRVSGRVLAAIAGRLCVGSIILYGKGSNEKGASGRQK